MQDENEKAVRAPMVRAILDGSKTQTRSVMKPVPQMVTDKQIVSWDGDAAALMRLLDQVGRSCPYGQTGDRLWVRESARVLNYEGEGATRRVRIRYVADDEIAIVPFPDRLKYVKPGNCIPNGCHREAARIWLEITRVRVERLQDISEADAKAEGTEPYDVAGLTTAELALLDAPLMDPVTPYKNGYALLWESLAGPGSWDANPWVWVIEFKVIKPQ
jgi:hypothetical protein